jgi:SAM-dependent methyltransferase
MPEIVKDCPLCCGDRHKLFESIQFRDFKVIYRICSRCGFVFQSPRQSETERSGFYASEYRMIYQGDEGPAQRDLIIQEKRAEILVRFIRKWMTKVNRHLDIGCSSGMLLETFQEQFGCTPVGIEPGNAYRNYAVAKGISVFSDIKELMSTGDQAFDLISLAHVLEHIPDPVAYLSNLRKDLLTPQGYLLIEVPNLYAHDSFEIAHLSAFSMHTLVQTIIKSGYSLVASMKHGKPRSKILPLYLTILAKAQGDFLKQAVVPERKVKIKRRYGMLQRKLIQKFLPHKAWIQI